MEIVKIEHMSEPEIFVVPPYMGWDRYLDKARSERPELLHELKHPAGIKKLTDIKIAGPNLPTASGDMTVLYEQGIIEFNVAETHLV